MSSTENSRAFRPARVAVTLGRMTAATSTAPVKLRSPADLIALVPYLLGFHPTDSVVVIAFRDRQLAFAARSDLPGQRGPVRAAVRETVSMVTRQAADAVALLGYGPAAAVDPVLRAVRRAADRRGLRVQDMLRIDDGRWWSYLCEDPRCCPPEGTRIDPTASEVTAWCAYTGLTAAASRAELAQRVAPVDEPAQAAMAAATDRARQALQDWLAALPESGREEAVLAEGTPAVQAAIARYADGGSLDDNELARLALLLGWIPVRDAAWRAITTEQPHLRLWTDVTRRADPALVPAPASLLALTAWRAGDGALAGLALERALAEDPTYSLATLILDALQQGIPPWRLDGWPDVPEDEEDEAPAADSDQATRSPPA